MAGTSNGRGHSIASKEGTRVCEGPCGQELPITKFPTLLAEPGQVPERGRVCRHDVQVRRVRKNAIVRGLMRSIDEHHDRDPSLGQMADTVLDELAELLGPM